MECHFSKKAVRPELETLLQDVLWQIKTVSELMKTQISVNDRITIYNFIINRIHARDTLKEIINEKDLQQR